MIKKVWNFGDASLIDGGVVVVADDYGYYVYMCNLCYDTHDYIITEDYIWADDLTDLDSWIDRDDVTSCAGYPSSDIFEYCEDDDMRANVMARYAADVIGYYGTQNLYSWDHLTEDEAKQRMKKIEKEI